eukprot:764324-Pelagomonas_calceolata.AAC.4
MRIKQRKCPCNFCFQISHDIGAGWEGKGLVKDLLHVLISSQYRVENNMKRGHALGSSFLFGGHDVYQDQDAGLLELNPLLNMPKMRIHVWTVYTLLNQALQGGTLCHWLGKLQVICLGRFIEKKRTSRTELTIAGCPLRTCPRAAPQKKENYLDGSKCCESSSPERGKRKLTWVWWVSGSTQLQGTRAMGMGSVDSLTRTQEDCVESVFGTIKLFARSTVSCCEASSRATGLIPSQLLTPVKRIWRFWKSNL